MTFWDSVKAVGAKAGEATKLAATKTKLRADMVLLDRNMNQRQEKFGVDLYDYISPLSQNNADFYAATDELTTLLRGPLIEAQKDIQALIVKREKLKEEEAQREVKRASTFATQAETFGDKLKNAGKSAYLAGGETKVKTHIAVVDRQITAIKQKFGVALFAALVEAEDQRNYLPTDRTVRSMYDNCRNDITNMEKQKKAKQKQLDELNGKTGGVGDSSPPTDSVQDPFASPSSGSAPASYSAPQSGFQDNPSTQSNNTGGTPDLLSF